MSEFRRLWPRRRPLGIDIDGGVGPATGYQPQRFPTVPDHALCFTLQQQKAIKVFNIYGARSFFFSDRSFMKLKLPVLINWAIDSPQNTSCSVNDNKRCLRLPKKSGARGAYHVDRLKE